MALGAAVASVAMAHTAAGEDLVRTTSSESLKAYQRPSINPLSPTGSSGSADINSSPKRPLAVRRQSITGLCQPLILPGILPGIGSGSPGGSRRNSSVKFHDDEVTDKSDDGQITVRKSQESTPRWSALQRRMSGTTVGRHNLNFMSQLVHHDKDSSSDSDSDSSSSSSDTEESSEFNAESDDDTKEEEVEDSALSKGFDAMRRSVLGDRPGRGSVEIADSRLGSAEHKQDKQAMTAHHEHHHINMQAAALGSNPANQEGLSDERAQILALRHAKNVQNLIQEVGDEQERYHEKWLRRKQQRNDASLGTKQNDAADAKIEHESKKMAQKLQRKRKAGVADRLKALPPISGSRPSSSKHAARHSASSFSAQKSEKGSSSRIHIEDPSLLKSLRNLSEANDRGSFQPASFHMDVQDKSPAHPDVKDCGALPSGFQLPSLLNVLRNPGSSTLHESQVQPTEFVDPPAIPDLLSGPHSPDSLSPSPLPAEEARLEIPGASSLEIKRHETPKAKHRRGSHGSHGKASKASGKVSIESSELHESPSRGKLAEVPRLRNKFRDQRVILHGHWKKAAPTLKRFNLDVATSLGLVEEDWIGNGSMYSASVADLQTAAKRKVENQRIEAATKVQRVWRAMRIYRSTKRIRIERLEAALRLQRWWRHMSAYRLPMHRKVANRPIMVNSVVIVQKVWRSIRSRRENALKKEMHGIIWRLDQLKTDLRAYSFEEVVQVQCVIRRFLARRRVSACREKRRRDEEREAQKREMEERRNSRRPNYMQVPVAPEKLGSVSHRNAQRMRSRTSTEMVVAISHAASQNLTSVDESAGDAEDGSSDEEVWCGAKFSQRGMTAGQRALANTPLGRRLKKPMDAGIAHMGGLRAAYNEIAVAVQLPKVLIDADEKTGQKERKRCGSFGLLPVVSPQALEKRAEEPTEKIAYTISLRGAPRRPPKRLVSETRSQRAARAAGATAAQLPRLQT